jgi:hypothetical protein
VRRVQSSFTPATQVYEQFVWSPRYIDAVVCRLRDANWDQVGGEYSDALEETLYYGKVGSKERIDDEEQPADGDDGLRWLLERRMCVGNS